MISSLKDKNMIKGACDCDHQIREDGFNQEKEWLQDIRVVHKKKVVIV